MARSRILAPNAGWKVTESTIICMAFGVIFDGSRYDALLTVAKANIMNILGVSHM